jgi:hypothetical protein
MGGQQGGYGSFFGGGFGGQQGGFGNSFGGGFGGQQPQQMQQQMQRPMQNQFGNFNQSPQMGGYGGGMGGGMGGGFNQYNPTGGGYGMSGFSPQMGGMGGFSGGYGPQMGGFGMGGGGQPMGGYGGGFGGGFNQPPQMGGFGGGFGQQQNFPMEHSGNPLSGQIGRATAGMQQTAQNSATATPPMGGGYDYASVSTFPDPRMRQQNQGPSMSPMQGAQMMMQRFGQPSGMGLLGTQQALQRGETGLSAMQQGGMQGQALGALAQPGMGAPLSQLGMAEGFNPQEGIERQHMQQQFMQQMQQQYQQQQMQGPQGLAFLRQQRMRGYF